MLESLPGECAEVDWGGPPFTEFVGLTLLTEEYPEVVMSLLSSLLPQRGGVGPRARGVWVLGTMACRSWHLLSSRQASSSLDSWPQCCSGLRYTTVTSRTPLGAVTMGEGGVRGEARPQTEHQGDPLPSWDPGRLGSNQLSPSSLSYICWTSLDSSLY